MAMSYRVANTAINDADRGRLLCMLLNTVEGKTDWKKAAEEYGSASVNSFKTMVSAAKKNLREATEKLEGEGGSSSAGSPTTSKNNKAAGKKRTNEDANGHATENGMNGKKKRARKTAEKQDTVDDELDDEKVKPEPEG